MKAVLSIKPKHTVRERLLSCCASRRNSGRSVIAVVAIAFCLMSASFLLLGSSWSEFTTASSNEVSKGYENRECSYMPAYNSTANPVWVPGYPGSGSEMFVEIIEAVTGLEGGNVYDGKDKWCAKLHPATCKTHWPWYGANDPTDRTASYHSKAILLLRNPRKAIPSYYNYLYEMRHGSLIHEAQAPEDKWKFFRNGKMENEVLGWKAMIVEWLKGPYEVQLMPYEKLTDANTSHDMMRRVATTLRTAGIDVAEDEDLFCLWNKVVREKPGNKRTRSYEPSFKVGHKQIMLDAIDDLLNETVDVDSELGKILLDYKDDIQNNTPLEA